MVDLENKNKKKLKLKSKLKKKQGHKIYNLLFMHSLLKSNLCKMYL